MMGDSEDVSEEDSGGYLGAPCVWLSTNEQEKGEARKGGSNPRENQMHVLLEKPQSLGSPKK